MRYGFLGPATTFTHQALVQALAKRPGGGEQVPFSNVAAAAADLVAGSVDAVMAPIENSVEGGVSGTLDVLAAHDDISIVAEEIVPITFVLAARREVPLDTVTAVYSHTHAQAQCQDFVRSQLPLATPLPAMSTAAAARQLTELDEHDPAAATSAAICSPLAAEHYGLHVLARGIEDNDGAQTRFILVQRDGEIPARTGADKTTIVAHLAHNRAGSLLEMLEVFSANGVDLSRIESRPIGDVLGRYSFSIDIEGHVEDQRVAASLRGLHRICTRLVFLGSYPKDSGAPATIEDRYSDGAFDSAADWVESIRIRVTK